MLQAVIFDRDGVLTYFDMAPAIAYLEPIVQLSIDEIAQRWWQWRDPAATPTDVVEEQALFAGFWDIMADDLSLSQEKRDQLHQFDYTTVVRAFPDSRPALLTAQQRGLRIGVLSNFELASLDASLEAAGLADLIDVACAAPVIGVAKPDPEAYLTVARALSVRPENCLFFDDELSWAEGARAVGMHAYFVDRDRAEHALSQGVVCDLSAISQLLTPAHNH
jgi:HAD superfamily hydrolase (TIGR01509 family)